MPRSAREIEFENAWRMLGPSGFHIVSGHVFDEERKWQFDFAELDYRVAIEIEGVTFFRGRKSRHQTARGYANDCEKYNRAAELGWIVLRYTQQHLASDPAFVIEQIENVLCLRGIELRKLLAAAGK